MSKQKKTIAQRIKDSASLISAVLVIGGALVGAGNWIIGEVSATTNERIDALEAKIDGNQSKNELSNIRLELMILMEHDPTNAIEIEKLAKKYVEKGGNSYILGLFSNWCKEYNADCEVVLK